MGEGLISISKNARGETVYGRTPSGQLVYDMLMTKASDRNLARKHKMPIKELRSLRRKMRAAYNEGQYGLKKKGPKKRG